MDTVANGDSALGQVLRQRRAELGLTQEDLAERTGLSVRAISDIERGRTPRPRRSSASLLASALRLGEPGADKPPSGRGPRQDASVASDLVVPRQLPAITSQFVGRVAELSALTGLLDRPDHGRDAVVVSAISGTAGVGKTALAVRWAHQMASRFPDVQLYIDLRGFGPASSVAPAEAIWGFLEALRVPPTRIPAQAEARVGLYRSLLADRRMLLLLDNAGDADHVRSLLPGSTGCLALITSRNPLTGLAVAEGARLVALDVLSKAEAYDLLALRLGAERLADEPAAADALLELTVGLPLALSIAAARATAHPGYPLATLVTELRDTRGRLEALAGGDTSADVRATISWSYRRLSDPAARLFRLLGIHPGPDVTVVAAASLSGSTPLAARRALAELAAGGLVTEHAPGRFACHDLLRVYAVEQSHDCDTGTSRRAASGRLLDHYLQTAHAAMLLINAVSEPLPLPPALPGARAQDLRTMSQAITWFTAEHDVLLSVAAEAARAGFDSHAWLLPATMATYLLRIGHWHDNAASQRAALAAAVRLDDTHAQARVHCRLGQALAFLRHDEEALASLRHALGMFGSLGDQAGEARTHTAIAGLMDLQHRHRESLNHARRALRLFHATGNRLGEAMALNEVGWDHIQLGDHEQALRCCQRALQLCREIGDHTVTADTWDSLGLVHLRLSQPAEAIGCYRQAIGEYRQGGHRAGEGSCLAALGDAQYSMGDVAEAASSWRQALEILSDLHHPDADRVRAKLEPAG